MSHFNIPIIFKKDEDNSIIANCPLFKWCHTFWENEKELENNLNEVISMYFEMAKDWENILEWDNVVFFNFNKNGQITDNFSKKFNKNFRKELSYKN